jgi:PKD repeat protein
VYALSPGGGLYLFATDIPYVGFSAAPMIGAAPLTVSFTTENALGVSAWAWDLGDGDSAFVADPVHVFERGLYTVSVAASNAVGGTDRQVRERFITALAETVLVVDTVFPGNTRGSWEISLSNSVPLTQLILPVHLSGVPEYVWLDSVSVTGTRLEPFELRHLLFDNRFNGELVMRYNPSMGGGTAPLPPGSGLVARVHFTLAPDVPEGTVLRLSVAGPVGGDWLTGATWSTSFAIVPDSAVVTVGAAVCVCPCHADPECDGVVNVLDVVRLADVAFRNAAPVFDPECIHSARTDVDCNGATDVLDVVTVVAVAFRNADPEDLLCEPCPL